MTSQPTPHWEPPADADPVIRQAPETPWFIVSLFALIGVAMLAVVFAVVWDIDHPHDSFSYRCEHSGGVVVSDVCVKKTDIIHP